MKIGQRFNKLTLKEYIFYIKHNDKYTDFNTLGLYRSIIENDKLSLKEKIELRDLSNTFFQKFFDFLQLRDPNTYFKIKTLGNNITNGVESKIWSEIKNNQKKILLNKKLRYRNFGTYSKHNCDHIDCHLNGLMIKKNSPFTYVSMKFSSDKNNFNSKEKSIKFKKERKNIKQNILKDIEHE
ncbi:MAG: hypothetical protein U0354_12465 [Candidatus Sericytochromatia bacterium]